MPKEIKEIAPIGYCNFRNQRTKFGIKVDDRRRHVYVIGKTGVGKTTLLENMVIADIQAGRGVGIVDPHGEFAEKMLDFIPENRIEDVIYFNPADTDHPIAFNPMERVSAEYRHLIASGLMGVFKKIWPDVWSARMEYILNNTLLSLLEFPNATVLGVMRMLSEPNYRKGVVENLQDPVIKAFWVNEFSRYSQRLESEAVAAIQNKVGQFVSNPLVRNIMGQPHSTLNMRKIMDEKKIFIANLSKGKIGEDNSALLGSMLITRLNLAAMSRVDAAEHTREDFFLYVDEFQNFATDSFANILSEARKYHLGLILSHQYIGQLVHEQNTRVRDAVFGNVGTIICFRVGAADAEFLEKEFMPEFLQTDLVNLAKAHIYTKLMIDGVASRPFSAETVPPAKTPLVVYKDDIIKMSREKFSTPRAIVEKKIASEWQEDSSKAIESKVARRSERPLGEALRRDGPPSRNYGPQQHGEGPPREYRERQPSRDYGPPSRDQSQFHRDDAPPRAYRDRPPYRSEGPRREERAMPSMRPAEPPTTAHQSTDRLGPPPIPRERPRYEPKAPKKPDVNIDDLRKAISASLGQNPSAPAKEETRPARPVPPPIRHKDAHAADKETWDEETENKEVETKKPFYVTDEDIADEGSSGGETVSLEELAEAEAKGDDSGNE
ncbi:MAG: type IV secretion system DNA-binding domain-containing protein [Patescibacteria group bacterium]